MRGRSECTVISFESQLETVVMPIEVCYWFAVL